MKKSAVFCLVLVCLASIYLSIRHVAAQTYEQRAIAVVNDVVGLNVSAYTASANAANRSLSEEDVDIRLWSSLSSLRVKVEFYNDKLRQIYISDYNGAPIFNQPTDSIYSMTKGFLERYQNYTGNPFYGELKSMLDNETGEENVTKIVGNVEFKLSKKGNMATYMWTYVDENGVRAVTKNFFVSYFNGQLESFMDNWQFFTIGGKPKISGEQALAIALKALRNFSYSPSEGEIVSKFRIATSGDPIKTALSYLNYPEQSEARGGDPSTFYPSWWVGIGFDNFYPGGITGVTVRLWADSGEVSSIDLMINGYPLKAENIEDTLPPNITILSPENRTYNTTTVSLMFNASEPVSWVDYSLDGHPNVTLTGNTTTAANASLNLLCEGSHSLTVYAADSYGSGANIGASDRIYFSVGQETETGTPPPAATQGEKTTSGGLEQTEHPFPTSTFIAVSVTAALPVALGILYQWKKGKHGENT